MKKKPFCIVEACLAYFIILLLVGCGSRIDYSLPANPIEFNTGTFINPNNPDDDYISIEYNGRTYIPYGTINGIVPKDEMGDCLGYIVQEGTKMEELDIPSVGGPYGEISVNVPDTWSYEPVHVDEEGLMYGLYGLILKPIEAQEGHIELVCTDTFGVCGTGLSQEEITLATVKAHVGTYDDHEHWDFITIGDGNPQIVIQHTDCDSWTDDMWDEAMTILDTVCWNMDKTEGGIEQYIADSELESLGLIMDVRNISPTGLTVHFRQYEKKDVDEIFYGEPYTLERLVNGKWEVVPRIVAEASYHDIAYIIPSEGESELETNWEWLYGRLDPGTYKITKLVMTKKEDGDSNPNYPLSAQFMIADSAVVRTYEATNGALSEEYIKNDKLITLVRHYEMTDGTWKTDSNTYKYRLEITGRMGGGAVKDSTFVYLSNVEEISFERAYMAAGLSSNMDDYFDPSEAVLVAMK